MAETTVTVKTVLPDDTELFDKKRGAMLAQYVSDVLSDASGEVVVDFAGITAMSRSTAHAFFAAILYRQGRDVLERLAFRNVESVSAQLDEAVEYLLQDHIYRRLQSC